jgi:hypothetical protein
LAIVNAVFIRGHYDKNQRRKAFINTAMAETMVSLPDALQTNLPARGREQVSVDHILESRHFTKAPLLSSFLTYVCRRTLDEGATRISEYEIGVNVFNRSDSFDPREDNIVRTYARHLRKRLQEYYSTEGQHDTICIDIPKGGYIPVFTAKPVPESEDADFALAEESSMEALDEHTPPHRSSALKSRRKLWIVGIFLTVIYSATLCGVTWQTLRLQSNTSKQLSPSHVVWSELFGHDRDTFIVPSDIGFVVLQEVNQRTFSLAEYLDWYSASVPADRLSMSYLKAQNYTSFLNLSIISGLQKLPEAIPNRFVLRATKNIRFDDLRDGNAILLGSNFSNPWDELFSKSLNFQFVNHPKEDRFWISNRHPEPGEATTYEAITEDYTHKTYAVVAFLPNLNHTGHVLLLEGIDTAGTQAAADMLFGGAQFQTVLNKALTSQGHLRSFEVLIETSSLDPDAHPTSARIIATRFY